MPAPLPCRHCSYLGGSLPPSACPGGSGDPRFGSASVLLCHCHQTDPRPTGGPEAEEEGCQDHHCIGTLLLHVLAPLRSGHLCGRPAAAGGPASKLQDGGRLGDVAVGGRAHGVRTLLPEPTALCLPGRRVQEFSPPSVDSEPGLQFEGPTPETPRNVHNHRVRVLQSTFQLTMLLLHLYCKYCRIH